MSHARRPENIDDVVKLVKHVCPTLLGDDLVIPEQGEESLVFISGDHVFIFPLNAQLQEKERRSNVITVLKCLDGKFKHSDFMKPVYGCPISGLYVFSKVAGTALNNIPHLNECEQRHIGEKLGMALFEFHQFYANGNQSDHLSNGRFCPPKKLSALETANNLFLKKYKTCPRLSDNFESAMLKSRQLVKSIESCEENAPLVLLHNDLHPANILYDQETDRLGIIDFFNLRLGYRYQEFRKIDRFPIGIQHACLETYLDLISSGLNLIKMDQQNIPHYQELDRRSF